MNDAIATNPGDDDSKKPVPVRPDTIKYLLEHPLRALPAEVRPAALLLWTTHRHLKGLETPLSISTAVGLWLQDYGLRSDDAVEILRSMCSPDSMANSGFTSDLITGLASRVHLKLRERRGEAARDELKRAEAERNKNNLPADVVREHLRRITPNIPQG